MDEQELRRAGAGFRVGEDLYGLSVAQLEERIGILDAETARLAREVERKRKEKHAAEDIFKKL